METIKRYNVKLERKGKFAWIVLRDKPKSNKMYWGSGAKWNIVEVIELN